VITVTLGTINFQFDRLVHSIGSLIENGVINEHVFIQHGFSDASEIEKHPLVTTAHKVPAEVLSDRIAQSRLVISHAGQGSTRYLAAHNVSFVIVPRLAMFEEHIDDHQLDFAKNVSKLGVVYCEDVDKLSDFIDNPPAPLGKNIFDGPKLSDFLAEHYSINQSISEALQKQNLGPKEKLFFIRRLQPFLEVIRDGQGQASRKKM
jgi:UDP-N-acetylglucosamine transferase subunit ALG13